LAALNFLIRIFQKIRNFDSNFPSSAKDYKAKASGVQDKRVARQVGDWHVLCSSIESCEKRRTLVAAVWVIQHIHCETPGIIAEALDREGISIQSVRVFAGEQIPKEMGAAAGLIVMGGPVGVYEQDRYPFFRDEICLIEQALTEKKAILGVCLGSQLLAAVLGAKVAKGKQKEIGWYPVTLSRAAMADPLWKGIESPFTAYHWHGDVFEPPRGAEALALSALTPCQAFRYGKNAYGFLFHMEVTEKIIQEMVQTFADELRDENISGRQITEIAESYLPRLREVGEIVFGRWASLVRTPPI